MTSAGARRDADHIASLYNVSSEAAVITGRMAAYILAHAAETARGRFKAVGPVRLTLLFRRPAG
jgi:hypothetical protein